MRNKLTPPSGRTAALTESERSTRLLFHTGVVLVFHIHCAVSGTGLAHHRTWASRAGGGGRCFRLCRVLLGQRGRNRDGEDSKTNNDDFLHLQLPRKRRNAVNHTPWIRVKNRSQSEPKSARAVCSARWRTSSGPPDWNRTASGICMIAFGPFHLLTTRV